MPDQQLQRGRLVSSVAATLIALACGSNYVFSAWGPQFAERLGLGATHANLIGIAGNLGMYGLGIPAGWLVDSKGPRPSVLFGSALLGLGYFPLYRAYESAEGWLPLLCLYSFMTGLGGCAAFSAAIKTSALNWPHHRGSATAFPLAAFGLSAFFFSFIGSLFFAGNTGTFLALLAYGTFGITFTGFFFLKVYPHTNYESIPRNETDLSPSYAGHSSSNVASRDVPVESRPATRDTQAQGSVQYHESGTADETASLVSCASGESSLAGEVYVDSNVDHDISHRVDIRGFALLREGEFWELFIIMALLSGIGLMTINNIGNDALALWRKYNPTVSEAFLARQQQMHVSILSLCSFAGRLLSGLGSDFLVKILHASRLWCLVAASLVFGAAQLCALFVTNPHLLSLVSALSGLGYGFLFGVFPSIMAETFGIHGLAMNWGFVTLAPIISGNVFNLFYGVVYDKHSTRDGPNAGRQCHDGIDCYWTAYLATLAAGVLGLLVSGAAIKQRGLRRRHVQGRRVD